MLQILFDGTKILPKTENYIFFKLQFEAFSFTVQKYGKTLPGNK
jgi:hypothetical protein